MNQKKPPGKAGFVIYVVFLLSGCVALVLETLWFKLAGLAFGNSVIASSLVLGSFMSGLGLGGFLAARFGDRVRNPIRTFAILETAIAITGLALVWSFPTVSDWLVPAFRSLTPNPLVLNFVRGGICFVLFLVPSTAMGATLPILVRELSLRGTEFGSALGRLYAINTFGAVLGAVVAELYLIPRWGIRGSALAAACIGILGAILVILSTRRGAHSELPPQWKRLTWTPKIVGYLMTATITGAALLGLEVIWMRYLLLYFNGTSMAFGLVLGIVLSGIGIGGMLASFLAGSKRVNVVQFLPHIICLSAISVVFGYLMLGGSQRADVETTSTLYIILSCTLILTFPTCILSGLIFTIVGKGLSEHLESPALVTGLLALCNTTGAAFGSTIAGLVLIPLVGVEKSLFWVAVLYGLLALACGFGFSDLRRASRRSALAFATFAIFALLALSFFPFGLMRNFVIPSIAKKFQKIDGGGTIIKSSESQTETSTYLRFDVIGVPVWHRLITNAHSMAGSGVAARRYMKLYAYFPFALLPNPKSALLICFGVGNTASALTESSTLESIDVVDISSNILRLSREVGLFEGKPHPLDDPRVHVHIEDGRFFLRTTEKKYDIITAEPPPPKNAGVSSLYSKEFFTSLRERLNDGGIVTYWLPVEQLLTNEAKAIARAFAEVFPDATLWTGSGTNFMLVGTKNLTHKPSEEEFSRIWKDPKISAGLIDIGLESPDDLGALFLTDGEDLRAWYSSVEPLTDNFPGRLSSRYPTKIKLRSYEDPFYMQQFQNSAFIQKFWPETIRERTASRVAIQARINEVFENRRDAFQALYDILTQTQVTGVPMILMGWLPSDIRLIQIADEKQMIDVSVESLRALQQLSNRNYPEAHRLFEKLNQATGESVPKLEKLALLSLCLSGKAQETKVALEKFKQKHGADEAPFCELIERCLAPKPR